MKDLLPKTARYTAKALLYFSMLREKFKKTQGFFFPIQAV